LKILLAVDGSKFSLEAVGCLVEHANWYRDQPVAELLTVQPPLPRLPGMGVVVGRKQVQRYYEEEGGAALKVAKRMLDAAGIEYKARVLVGPVAESIVQHAARAGCDLIYIGTHGRTAAGNMLLGSVATKVLHISGTPVLLVR